MTQFLSIVWLAMCHGAAETWQKKLKFENLSTPWQKEQEAPPSLAGTRSRYHAGICVKKSRSGAALQRIDELGSKKLARLLLAFFFCHELTPFGFRARGVPFSRLFPAPSKNKYIVKPLLTLSRFSGLGGTHLTDPASHDKKNASTYLLLVCIHT